MTCQNCGAREGISSAVKVDVVSVAVNGIVRLSKRLCGPCKAEEHGL